MQNQTQQRHDGVPAARLPWEKLSVEVARQERDQMARAIWADNRATQTVALSTLWDELLCLRQQVVSHFTTETRAYLIVRATSGAKRPVMGDRYRYALQGLVRGLSQKKLAVELGVSDAAITSRLNHAMAYLGLDCRASVMPLMVAMAGMEETSDLRVSARISTWTGAAPTRILSIPRPDTHLPKSLSQAECAILRLLIEGRSRREMAEMRQTSCHTIANQVSAIFCKLGTSSRFWLIRQLWLTASMHRWPNPTHGVLTRERGSALVEGGAASALGGY